MKSFYAFSGDGEPALGEVGGKGLSLIKMARSGLPVPDGFVLTVDFFGPWIRQLGVHPEWEKLLSSPGGELKKNADAVKALCPALALTGAQKRALEKALEGIDTAGREPLFAVRSSSPEEDLAGASFAGGYETVLGVRAPSIEDALRRCFASCLDERVFVYKKEHGFDVKKPRIAVVVQEQVPSDTAGVGFSLNPLTNCYDEAVINANWGLGESVVSGMVSPDQFIVDKVGRKVTGRTLGKKETSVWLKEDGGTLERPDPRREEFSLSDAQVLELTDVLSRIESLYERPMDIEWAFAGGRLYMLQARPITTDIPLPEELLTPPGEPRRLYLDVTLCVQGIQEPLSVMGCDWLKSVFTHFTEEVLGEDLMCDIATGIGASTGGRLYLNLSNLFLVMPKDKYADRFARMDSLAAEIVRGIEESRYRNATVPPTFKDVKWKALRHIPDTIARVFEGAILPGMLDAAFHRGIRRYLVELRAARNRNLSVKEFSEATVAKTLHLIVHVTIPTLIASQIADSKVRTIFKDAPPEVAGRVSHLDRSLPGNVTVEMGLALYHLSQLLPPGESRSPESLARAIEERSLPGGFLHAWDDFMEKYGFRGPRELDIASPRYADDPEMLLQQMVCLTRNRDEAQSPQAVYDRSRMERHRAYEALAEEVHKMGWLKSKEFQRLYRVIETLGGYRETHKYYVIMINHMLRQRVLREADGLVAAGRLDRREQVFDLTVADLDEGLKDPSIDLRARAGERTRFLSRLAHVKRFPRIIDSRGTILRPLPKPCREGELAGQAISPGTVRGPVKVLATPTEKPIEPGDILVAKATDPGWTPLFINAAAVVLEVGGMLQHGALVAREYGKPCVAGIDNVTSLLKDGESVEVDGSAGVVRLLDKEDS